MPKDKGAFMNEHLSDITDTTWGCRNDEGESR